jgi:hypothetical protein
MYVLILTKKIGWAIFWATFSKTHLVTLQTRKHTAFCRNSKQSD